MSGHKRATVTLSEADLRKLAGVEGRLRQVESDYQDIRRKARQEQDGVLWRGLQALEERQQAIQSALGGLDDGLAQVEAASAQAFREQAGQAQAVLSGQLEALGEGLWQETASFLEAQQHELHALTVESLAARQAQLGQLEEHLQAERADRWALAEGALQAAEALLGTLEAEPGSLHPAPAELAQVRLGLELARRNLEAGVAEAALVGAQQVYLQASRLRLEQDAREWQRHCLLGAACGRARGAYERALHLAQVAAVDLDGNELAVQIDVGYWSGGDYDRALQRCQALLELLEGDAQELDEAQLVEVQEVQLAEVEAALDEAVYRARCEVLASQVRYNLAECVIRALGEQGFRLQGGGYQGSDPRCDYQALVRHYDGSEVVVQVAPVEAQVGISQLDLHSRDSGQRTAHELRQRGREIAQALQAYGLQVGPGPAGAYPRADPGSGMDPSLRVAERPRAYHGRD